MDGHQLHLVLGVIPAVRVGEQGGIGQVVGQRHLLAAGGLIHIHRLFQLRQIVQPLLTALGAEHLLIAALIEDSRQHLRHGLALVLGGE